MNIDEHNLMTTIAATAALRECVSQQVQRRHKASPNDLLWSYARRSTTQLAGLRQRLHQDGFQFNPVAQRRLRDGTWVSRYEPEDQVVLSRMSSVLTRLCQQKLDLSQATHVKGQGGLKGAVRKARFYTEQNVFVFKTDIADFYESINHNIMQRQMNRVVKDKRVRRLLWDSMERLHVCDGEYRHVKTKGISRGCSLSPLMGAVYLTPLDAYAKSHEVDYVRYMDDVVFFTRTKKKLREVIKGIYPVLTELGLTLAFDKTWIGRVATGFDFLGYRLSPDDMTVAVRSFKRMTEKLRLLYEQGADQARRRSYVTHWLKWAQSGVALNTERRLKTTTNILQDTVGFHSASVLLPE